MTLALRRNEDGGPAIYYCTECGLERPDATSVVMHACPRSRREPRPSTRQAALGRLASDAETLGDKAHELFRELKEADAPFDLRARARRASSMMHQIMDEIMDLARDEDQR